MGLSGIDYIVFEESMPGLLIKTINSLISNNTTRKTAIRRVILNRCFKDVISNNIDYGYFIKGSLDEISISDKRKKEVISLRNINKDHVISWLRNNNIAFTVNRNTVVVDSRTPFIADIYSYLITEKDLLIRYSKEIDLEYDENTFWESVNSIKKIYLRNKDTDEFIDNLSEIFGQDLSIIDKFINTIPSKK